MRHVCVHISVMCPFWEFAIDLLSSFLVSSHTLSHHAFNPAHAFVCVRHLRKTTATPTIKKRRTAIVQRRFWAVCVSCRKRHRALVVVPFFFSFVKLLFCYYFLFSLLFCASSLIHRCCCLSPATHRKCVCARVFACHFFCVCKSKALYRLSAKLTTPMAVLWRQKAMCAREREWEKNEANRIKSCVVCVYHCVWSNIHFFSVRCHHKKANFISVIYVKDVPFFDKMLSPCFYLQINGYMTSLCSPQNGKWLESWIKI